jgi:hypothetical protein
MNPTLNFKLSHGHRFISDVLQGYLPGFHITPSTTQAHLDFTIIITYTHPSRPWQS